MEIKLQKLFDQWLGFSEKCQIQDFFSISVQFQYFQDLWESVEIKLVCGHMLPADQKLSMTEIGTRVAQW